MALANIFLSVISPYTAFLPLFFMAYSVLKKKYQTIVTPWNIGLLLLFTWSLLSGIVNKSLLSSAASFVLLLYFFMSVYFQNRYNEEWKVEKLFNWLLFFSTGSAVIGIMEKLTVKYFGVVSWGYLLGIPHKDISWQRYRIYSTFGNPNVAGAWYAFAILLCLYFHDNREGFKKNLYMAGAALFTWTLILTGSRGAAFGLILGLICYVFLKGINKNVLLLSLVIVLVSISMFIPLNQLSWFHNEVSVVAHDIDNSMINRLEIWGESLKMFGMKPFTGWGLLGIYTAGSDVFQFHLREPHAHNIWLTLGVTLGVIGLGVYLYMRFYIIKEIKFLITKGCKLAPLLAGIQMAFIGHGLVDVTPMTPQGGIIFFGCTALICALSYTYRNSMIDGGYAISTHSSGQRAA